MHSVPCQCQPSAFMPGTFVFICLFFVFAQADAGENNGWELWPRIETKYVVIRYQKRTDLDLFYTQIRFGQSGWNKPLDQFTLSKEKFNEIIGEKTDAVFLAAQQILDMNKKFSPVNIILYPDSRTLKKAYRRIYHTECTIRAWYAFQDNTIHLNIRDLHVGILAHEMAHAMIDHYLAVRPARADRRDSGKIRG